MSKPPTSQQHAKLLKYAAAASVVTAAVLILIKLFAWYATGSVSVLASLIDSLMDVGASLFNFFAIRISLQPPDAEHRFGHGKAESVAGLTQATFILGSAFFLVLETIHRFVQPQAIQEPELGVYVMSFSLVLTLVLLLIQRYVILQTNSSAIRADALHYFTDLLAGLGVLAALVLTQFFPKLNIDVYFALTIAMYILYSAWRIGFDSVQSLIDHELPDAERNLIQSLALAHGSVLGVHDMRTRQAGSTKFIQLHLDLDGRLTLEAAHLIAEEVEAEIEKAFPNADIIIQQDPSVTTAP